jgi:hypothetical protein
MTILDSGWSPNSPSPGDILVCVGYKNHWDIVNGRSGYAQHLHTVESTKAHLVAALDLYEDQEVQLLLCYNRKLRAKPPNPSLLSLSLADTCHFQKINEENSSSTDFDFHWNSVPTDIGEYWASLAGSSKCPCSLRISLRDSLHV